MSHQVYRMNEFDWVVAKSMDEAIEYYEGLTGEKTSEEEIEECDLENDGQYIDFDDEQRIEELETQGVKEVIIPVDGKPHKHGFGSLLKRDRDWHIRVPFKDVLPTDENEAPYITASTEW